MTRSQDSAPLIAHVIYRLSVGGLENGLVNLINNLPEKKYNHNIICITESSDFSQRITRKDVKIFEVAKKPGKDFMHYFRLWKIFRKIKPTIVHSRNLPALEANIIAALAGVRKSIHGEHGRDIYDLYGKNRKYKILRKICGIFINKFVALSKDLENWLVRDVGVRKDKVVQLYNGVDTRVFKPKVHVIDEDASIPISLREDTGTIVVGTVGRIEEVKDQITLVKAFALLVNANPSYRKSLKLVLLGDGQLRNKVEELIENEGIEENVWITGKRNDVPTMLCQFDIFVLPSLAEGISNTILEAMAVGLPIVATNVGGNPELVVENQTGILVEPKNPEAMAKAIEVYVQDKSKREAHSEKSLYRVESQFSMEKMIKNYEELYDSLLYVP